MSTITCGALRGFPGGSVVLTLMEQHYPGGLLAFLKGVTLGGGAR